MRLKFWIALSTALALFATPGFARQEDRPTLEGRTVDVLRLDNVDVRQAIADFFTQQKVHVLISPGVRGQVTLYLRKLDATKALQMILRQVDATYRVRSGIYEVMPRGTEPLETGDQATGGRAVLRDDSWTYVLEGSRLSRLRKSSTEVESSILLTRRIPGARIDLADGADQGMLRGMLRYAEFSVEIAPEAKWTVTIPEGPARLSTVNEAFMKAFPKNYLILGGDYLFYLPVNEYAWLKVIETNPLPQAPDNLALSDEGEFVVAISGRWSYKVRKSDFKIVRFSEAPPPSDSVHCFFM